MIVCENLVKIYKTKEIEVVALQGLDMTVEDGELMAIIGNSGSGKSTLLNMIGGLDQPSAGKLIVNGQDMLKMTKRKLIRYKRDVVGFVWQNNARNLVPYLTAVENVELPMILKGKRSRSKALELLERVGMSHRKDSRLEQLSGGEQQRIAIAIALANDPKLLLADEPTGAVDSNMSMQILDLLGDLNRQMGLTVVIVTHDMQLSKKVDRVVAIRDGRTSSEIFRKSYRKELEQLTDVTIGGPEPEEEHIEVAVMDRTGRVQIPRDTLDQLGISGRAHMQVELDNGRIVLIPHQQNAAQEDTASSVEA